MDKFEFGYECRDVLTGNEGILKSRLICITGCYRVELFKDKEGKWSDSPLVKIINKGVYDDLQELKNCNKFDDIEDAKYKFGSFVKDTITGFSGKIVAICLGVVGDISYAISPQYNCDVDRESNDAQWFDEGRIKLLQEQEEENTIVSNRSGGAVPNIRCR